MITTGSADLRTDPDRWRDKAACAGMTTDLWFPPDGERGHFAQQVCYECPVRAECLQDALQTEGDIGGNNRHGIYGGLGPYARAKYARTRDPVLLRVPTFKCGHPRTATNTRSRPNHTDCVTCRRDAA